MEFGNATVTGERFSLGRTVITRGALAHCEDNEINYLDLLMRHATGDFGEVGRLADAKPTDHEQQLGPLATSDDLKLNAIAVLSGDGMVMSVYTVKGNAIWIQTMLAGAETYTTILLPSEY